MSQAKKALAKKSRTTAAKKQSQTYTNYIGGRWVPSASGEWIENRNPADTRDAIGRFPQSTEEDVDDGLPQLPRPSTVGVRHPHLAAPKFSSALAKF